MCNAKLSRHKAPQKVPMRPHTHTMGPHCMRHHAHAIGPHAVLDLFRTHVFPADWSCEDERRLASLRSQHEAASIQSVIKPREVPTRTTSVPELGSALYTSASAPELALRLHARRSSAHPRPNPVGDPPCGPRSRQVERRCRCNRPDARGGDRTAAMYASATERSPSINPRGRTAPAYTSRAPGSTCMAPNLFAASGWPDL